SAAPEFKRIRNVGATPGEGIDGIYPKREVSAITGYFMEPIWRETHAWMKEHPHMVATLPVKTYTDEALELSARATSEIVGENTNDAHWLAIELYRSSLAVFS